jgi:hypothetical protein
MRSLLLTLALLSIATPGFAATCDESFQKKGDFFNGTAFSGRVQVEELSIEKAFSQLRVILAREGIRTVSADVSTGVLKAENPATPFQRALPIDVFALADGNLLNVEMVFTLPGGVGASKSTVKKYICGALNQLLPQTPPTPAVQADSTVTDVDTITLAKQVTAAADNPARLRLNFIGKTFRVSGKVVGISDQAGSYSVSLDGTPPTAGTSSASKTNRTTILCTMAKNQDAAVAALQTHQRATLVGRFQSFDSKTNSIKLQDCTGR